MQIEVKIDGELLVNMQLNESLLTKILQQQTSQALTIAKSTSISVSQAKDLLSRIDTKSVQFLKQIAVNNGEIGWGEMRQIFGINDDWTKFSSSFGKGITRALRHLTNDKSARIIWWDDADWPDDGASGVWDHCKVYIDGPALKSLREAAGIS